MPVAYREGTSHKLPAQTQESAMKTNYRYILSSLLTGLLVFTPPAHAKKDKHAQQPIVSLQGKVVHYLINPFGEINGLFSMAERW